MFENMSYEKILNRMLNRVSDQIDKREGSIIYDALAPAAMEIMMMYTELENVMLETFADTASREYLIRRAAERGLFPEKSTYAVLKGVFNMEIAVGSRFSNGDLNYRAIQKIKDKEYKMQCETLGVIGNKNFGDLIPIDYIEGLTSAKLTELLIPGEDEESTEDFRKRYFKSFDTKAYGGNVDDYLKKTNAIAGVGSTKVTPIWNGGGTVKLTILDSEFNKASSTLVETVQKTIDPTKDGTGIGVAPIGHIVTVDTVEEVEVNINADMTFDEGTSFTQLKPKIIEVVKGYLLEIRKSWATQNTPTVRIAQIEARIVAIPGVIDITDTKINNLPANLVLDKYQIPTIGVISNG